MTAPLPTPDEVAAMRERHRAEVVDGLHYCLACQVSAPCDADQLLELVDALRVLAVDRIRRATTGEAT
ncbi:hypothetical protein [Cellulomonas shaoxiangyii]|uniref:Uncharacterized protein n=1 Tax=Cellulomonas shaoxiangyii TaxID=2566013 RepID=A0A4P7SL80_9CELL|nr:hypothetical protein [Cellulomonas shaoxiangyii]QCB93313.1 hypothetical protein E5225_06875 [Cellulomonas shaoxiangyii]TGY79418.1 hypothetical protein E5226_15405 [Cellulomonas shaoxiangyii]